MTTRPGHTLGGMRRLAQMLTERVTIYVEGRNIDRYFYGQICGPICRERGLSYNIFPADIIAGGGGGKGKLITLFKYLRQKKRLLDRDGVTSKIVIFYLDKDTDDIFQKKCRSPHVVYTSSYCVENHLFCDADLIGGIAAGGTVDPETVRRRIPNPNQWRKDAAVSWRDWIVLCLVAQKLYVRCESSYSVDHGSRDSRVNATNLATCQAYLQSHSGKSLQEFDQIMTWARRKVDGLTHQDNHDQVFKGKWYTVFAKHELDQISRMDPPANTNGADGRLIGSLCATLRFEDTWAEHYKAPLRQLIGTI